MTKIVEMEYWNSSYDDDTNTMKIIFKDKDDIRTPFWFGSDELFSRFGDESIETRMYFLELKGTTILDFVSAEGLGK